MTTSITLNVMEPARLCLQGHNVPGSRMSTYVDASNHQNPSGSTRPSNRKVKPFYCVLFFNFVIPHTPLRRSIAQRSGFTVLVLQFCTHATTWCCDTWLSSVLWLCSVFFSFPNTASILKSLPVPVKVTGALQNEVLCHCSS